jgi:hypothetical protein
LFLAEFLWAAFGLVEVHLHDIDLVLLGDRDRPHLPHWYIRWRLTQTASIPLPAFTKDELQSARHHDIVSCYDLKVRT